jgi:hypothetical protein
MRKNEVARSHSSKKLLWFILPLVLLAVLISGGFSLSRTNAAPAAATPSPLNGRYIFHAITQDGPRAGLSIHGSLALTSLQEGVVGRVGTLCQSTLDPRGCTIVTGTVDDNAVTLVIHATATFPSISLNGVFEPIRGEHGAIRGTFSFGTGEQQSTGSWIARVAGHVPTADGIWHISGHVTLGPDTGRMFFRGTLDLVQTASNSLVGMYCPERHGAQCVSVVGENRNGYVFIYVDNPVAFKLRGTFRSLNQLVGTVEVFNSADRGVWSASRIA